MMSAYVQSSSDPEILQRCHIGGGQWGELRLTLFCIRPGRPA